MLSSYPIYFDTTELDFFPATWEESYEVVENVFQTEAGTDVVEIVRNSKLSVSVGCRRDSAWMQIFKEFSMKQSFVLKIYDFLDGDYVEHTVRMRDLSYKLVRKSENISVSEGLWDISFRLEEF